MWKYRVVNAYDYVSLNDCVIKNMKTTDNLLSFPFDDGFWMIARTKYNSYEEAVQTDKSEINFIDFDKNMSVFFIFKRHCLFGKHIYTTRKKVDLDKVFERINSGEWEIEFSDQYFSKRRVLFFGSVNTRKLLWAFDFQLVIDCEKMEYCWNDACTDRKNNN